MSVKIQTTQLQMPDNKGVEIESSEEYIQKPLIAETAITVEPKRLSSTSNKFAPGNCTAYVASKRSIPWSGNAKDWLTNAQSYGFSVGDVPEHGAILVTSESKDGHVAYTEEVDSDGIVVSEMNYKGLGIISTRKIAFNSPFIKGYIYN